MNNLLGGLTQLSMSNIPKSIFILLICLSLLGCSLAVETPPVETGSALPFPTNTPTSLPSPSSTHTAPVIPTITPVILPATPTINWTPAVPTPESPNQISTSLTILTEGNFVSFSFLYTNISEIILVDYDGTPLRKIDFYGSVPIHLGWSPDGCLMNVTLANGIDIKLVGINLAGNIQQEYFFGGYNFSGEWMTWPKLSPNQEWVTYVVWSGDHYYDSAEFQDVEVISLSGESARNRLTERGGAWKLGATWAPDSSRLAYSDYDQNGVIQAYHSNPGGSEQEQLTRFEDQNMHIGPIEWSPDGLTLAFIAYSNYQDEGESSMLWVVSADGSNLHQIELQSDLEGSNLFWFSEDNSTIMMLTNSLDEPNGQLVWFNVISGEIINILSSSLTGELSFLFLFDGIQTVGFYANGYYNQYNLSTDQITPWARWDSINPNRNSDPRSIVPVPLEEIDINACLNDMQ